MNTPQATALQYRYLDCNQAAALVGVCTKTLRRWEAAGRLTVLRTPGGHRRYERDVLLAEALKLNTGTERS